MERNLGEPELFGGCVSNASFLPINHLVEPHAWIEHLPFALWLMGAARPRTVVELGTHTGNSFFAFCQGSKFHELNARLWSVDTWRGDAHAGYYGDSVYEAVRS